MPLADLSAPEAGSALVDALRWIEGIMLGPVAVTLAVAGVALVGLLLLQGRIAWQRGLAVCLGCFIVFGAWPIVHAASVGTSSGDIAALRDGGPLPEAPKDVPPQAYDPYAGASLGN